MDEVGLIENTYNAGHFFLLKGEVKARGGFLISPQLASHRCPARSASSLFYRHQWRARESCSKTYAEERVRPKCRHAARSSSISTDISTAPTIRIRDWRSRCHHRRRAPKAGSPPSLVGTINILRAIAGPRDHSTPSPCSPPARSASHHTRGPEERRSPAYRGKGSSSAQQLNLDSARLPPLTVAQQAGVNVKRAPARPANTAVTGESQLGLTTIGGVGDWTRCGCDPLDAPSA